MTTDAVLELHQVTKTFASGDEQLRVLDEVSLTIDPGALHALVGRSGSGKTTLLTVALGWEEPDAGEVRWHGQPRRMASVAWEEIAFIPQSLGLLEELTIAENVNLPSRLAPDATAAPVAELLWQLGIDQLGERYPSEVSLGEQQRAAVARALVLQPSLVLADEPVAHQNDAFVDAVLSLFEALAVQGGACLIATHNTEVLGRMTAVTEMHGGRLTRTG